MLEAFALTLDIDEGDFARLFYLGALAVFVGAGLFSRRQTIGRDLKALAFWVAALALLVALYGFRNELKTVGQRFLGVLAPGLIVESGGELTVTRAAGGMFMLQGSADGAPVSFMFDTGASAVVLTAGDAARAGFRPREAEFTVSTSTANGVTTVAPVTIRRMTIGSLTQSDVRAFVARPGALSTSLLGHTFLDRLESYEVRGDRLILRGR